MASIKHIVITVIISALLLGGIIAWVGYRNGDIVLPLETQSDEPLPGPLSPVSEPFNINEETMDTSSTNPTVTLQTSMGDVVLELYQDRMPITVGNFLKLAGEDFYDNTKFHRVIEGFMVQGGDPNSKTDNVATYGQGGPGYTIQDEFVADPLLTNARGTISMANTGQPNSGGSQFFINLVDNTFLDFDKEPLSSKHPVFGRVIEGMDVVDAIAEVEKGPRDMPITPIVIKDVVVSAE